MVFGMKACRSGLVLHNFVPVLIAVKILQHDNLYEDP